MSKDFFTEFYVDTKGLLEKKAEEEIEISKEEEFNKNLDEVLNKKAGLIDFAKNNSGALIGAGVGGALGTGVGYHVQDENKLRNSVIGGLAGAGLGGLAGHAIHSKLNNIRDLKDTHSDSYEDMMNMANDHSRRLDDLTSQFHDMKNDPEAARIREEAKRVLNETASKTPHVQEFNKEEILSRKIEALKNDPSRDKAKEFLKNLGDSIKENKKSPHVQEFNGRVKNIPINERGPHVEEEIKRILSGQKDFSKNADFKQKAIRFAKDHPKMIEGIAAGSILGGGSELVMPSRTDQFGRPSTNISEVGKRALLGGAIGGLGGEIKSKTRTYIDKLGNEKTAIVGPMLDGAAFMIPSMVGYHMGKGKGQKMYEGGEKLKDPSQLKLWMMPGYLGHLVGEANGHMDSYIKEKGDMGNLDDYYANNTDESVNKRWMENEEHLKRIMSSEFKRKQRTLKKEAGISEIAGKILGGAAGAATKAHEFSKNPTNRKMIAGGALGLASGIPVGLSQYENNKRIQEGKGVPVSGMDMLSPTAGGIASGLMFGIPMAGAGAVMGKTLAENPHMEQALGKAWHGLKSHITPDTTSLKGFLKDPITQHGALGAGAGAAYGLGASSYRDEDTGEIKFDPNISQIVGGTLLGGAMGVSSGAATRANNQLDTLNDMVDKIRMHHKSPIKTSPTKKLYPKYHEAGTPIGFGVDLLDKTAGIGDFVSKHPIMTGALGGAALGGGLGALTSEEGQRGKGALTGAAILGGIGTGLGLRENAGNQMAQIPSKLRKVVRNWERWHYDKMASEKEAFFAPAAQMAGKLMQKNPHLAGAALGAGTGLVGNALSGQDNPGFSAAVGAVAGGLGGKQILNLAKKQNTPLLGQNFRRGAIQENLRARNVARGPAPSPIKSTALNDAPSLNTLVQDSGAKNVGPQISNIPQNPMTTPKAPQEMNWAEYNKPSFINRASQKLKTMVG